MTHAMTRCASFSALALSFALLSISQAANPKPDAQAMAANIDRAILKKLLEEGIAPASKSTDSEFIRRVYLDLVGILPPVEKVKSFLNDTDPAKRTKLIDELLASDRFGRHLADIWQGLLLPRTSDNRRLSLEPMTKWLTERFNENRPWDKLVSDLITASGDQDKNGAVTFFLVNATADKMTDQATKLFLGVQLQCAQCHDHPFTGWKREEYWGMATFFSKVRPDNAKKAKNPDAKLSVMEGPQRARAKLPESAMNVPAKFLLAEKPTMRDREPYRPVLAKWLTSSANPYFTKAMVNRVWHQLFGRGIVTPVDDMHEANKPTHPELLAELSRQISEGGFDLKQLYRAICNSDAYQRASAGSTEEDDGSLFGHMAVKVLSPEQLYDSLTAVLAPPENAARGRARPKAALMKQRGMGNDPRAAFVNFFHTEDGADPLEYQAGVPQALRLMNAQQISPQAPLLQQALKAGKPADTIQHLFLGAYARNASPEELAKILPRIEKEQDPKKAYADVLWALVNSSEFALNH